MVIEIQVSIQALLLVRVTFVVCDLLIYGDYSFYYFLFIGASIYMCLDVYVEQSILFSSF